MKIEKKCTHFKKNCKFVIPDFRENGIYYIINQLNRFKSYAEKR